MKVHSDPFFEPPQLPDLPQVKHPGSPGSHQNPLPPPAVPDGVQLQKPALPSSQTSVDLDLEAPKLASRFVQPQRSVYLPFLQMGPTPGLVNPLPTSGFETPRLEQYGGVALRNPAQSSERIFSSTDAPSQMVAALYENLEKKYPNLEKNVLWRLAVVSTYVAVDVPLMVAAHEMGHGGSVHEACPGCSPQVVMTGWMGGYTSSGGLDTSDPKTDLLFSVAGMNQATFQGEEINRRMHTQSAELKDAIGYLVNITNSVNYQIKDWIQKNPPGFDDAASYHHLIESRDKGWNQQNLSLLALGVNLANADFWASLVGSAKYIATGDELHMPEIKVGPAHVSFPHFSLMHTYEGPQLNTSIYGHLGTEATLEMKYSQILTPDQGAAFGVETHLHRLTVPRTQGKLKVSPGVGVSTYQQKPGFKASTEVLFQPSPKVPLSFSTRVDYRHNYLPDDTLINTDRLQVETGLHLSF